MDSHLKTPLISVLMPVYNRENFLREAIDSILNQTETDFELLILDDGSTDQSASIARSYTDSRIRFISNDRNRGIVYTMNKGIHEARGHFIARMDSDDIALPERFEKEVHILLTMPEVGFVAGLITQMDEQGKELGPWADDRANLTHAQIRWRTQAENCIANPTVMFRREVLQKYRYNKHQVESEDWDLWLRMFSNGEQIYKINEVLLLYRIHRNSITVQYNRKSLYLKKARIQLVYVFSKFRKLQELTRYDIRVFRNGVLNFVKHLAYKIHPRAIPTLKQIFHTNPIAVVVQYRNALRQTHRLMQDGRKLFFFFPYFHTGGAEKVHTQILETVSDRQPVVFMTAQSSGNGLESEFRNRSTLLDISLVSDYPILHRALKKRLAKLVAKVNHPVLFGCNSYFYYALLPFLPPGCTCIDLMHGFSHPGEPGPEYASLPVVSLLTNRVVITRQGARDFERIYAENNIAPALLERVLCIPNFTFIPPPFTKTRHAELKIIYVGRDTPEKRVYLFGTIARKLHEYGIQAQCMLAGPGADALNPEDKLHCTLLGEVRNENVLRNLYAEADILLLLSTREGFPLVIMEAMAHGVVPVSTRVGGISEHVIPEKNGILLTPGSEETLIEECVTTLLRLHKDRIKLEEMSINCYAYASGHFDQAHFIQGYRKLLLAEQE
ncbi:MAG TPA: glycosyltransferase [Bacteroidia bacterium]|jgi:glycosyltransferase involved in cell wall biosynthesis|nr:glycosyltransferase [Bacteroidia bacterium]